MASLTASDPNEIALVSSPTSGTATFHVDPAGSGANVETWERNLVFGAVTSPPPFVNSGTFSAIANVARGVPLGGVHQVRLFRQNQGHSSGVPSNPGSLLGRLDFPCVRRAARINFLTRCASMPQIDITRGGTFVSMSFAVNVPARARVQIGVNPPTIDAAGFPVFAPADIVSSVLSDGPKLLQKASLVQDLFASDASAHSALQTGQKLFFIVLCWDQSGSWDFVWNTTGVAPLTGPESFKTRNRTVQVRLHRLRCLDDSDDFSRGEATFKFIVNDDTAVPATKDVSWSPMPTGGDLLIPSGTTDVKVSPPNAAGGVSIRVEGVEDDSGSFPPDDNDTAAVGGLAGNKALPFPVGEVKEQVNDALLTFYSDQTTFGEKLSFIAEVVYSVTYA